jgi:hypothetical protein
MNQNNQQLIKASVVIVIIAGLLGALSVLGGNIGAATAKIFSVSFILIFFGITASICMAVTRKSEYKILGTAGMVVSGAAFLLFFIMILGETGGEGLLKLAFTLVIAAFALAHICFLHYITVQNKYASYARIIATISITLFSFFLIIQIFEPLPNLYMLVSNQSSLKVISALLIFDLAATLLVPLCNRLKTESPVEVLSLSSEKQPSTDEKIQ